MFEHMVMLLSFTGGWGEGECAEGQTESSYTAHTGTDGWDPVFTD